MEIEKMHFDGQIWRPPYEASSQLLQVTAGCTYHKCKFCSLYHGTKFRLSPVSEVESDLKIIQEYQPKAKSGIQSYIAWKKFNVALRWYYSMGFGTFR